MYEAVYRERLQFDSVDMSTGRRGRNSRGMAVARLVDVVIAAAAIAFLAPLLLTLATLIFLQDGGAPLFRHRRIGLDGRGFHCLKFRSMAVNAEEKLQALLSADPTARADWERDHKLKRDPRVTRIGSFLRKSSLDELPQLLNVLSGDMSLVGPRPIVESEVRFYGRHFPRYCAVRPGITGLWQVSGRNDLSYQRRVVLDVAYVRNRGLGLNIRILLATVPAVLLRKGSY